MGGRNLARSLTVLAAGLCAALTGCTIESPLSVRRVWADFNTLRMPAVYYDKVSHVPMDAARVRELRWMYNKGPHELGPYSLIPPPRGLQPTPAPTESPNDSDVAPPLPKGGKPLPQSPAGRSPGGPPLPPLPGQLNLPRSTGPVADRRKRRSRTTQVPGAWRFLR
ncbi:MAG: hypothetical protein ACE5KM_02595 [Planctomycetaceae bacterium]